MARIDVEVEGFEEVLRALTQLGNESKVILHGAVNKGAEYLAPKIKANIPIGSSDDLHLRDAIKISRARPKRTIKQSASINIGRRSANYGFHVETGREGVAPRPFMRSTADHYQSGVAEEVAKEIFERLGM